MNDQATLKIGIVGVGHFGSTHAKVMGQSKFDFVGFYDINPDTSEKVSNELGIKSFDSLDSLLKEVDAVDIVVPTHSHYEVAEKVIQSGKHAFIEKPVTNKLENALKIRDLAEKFDVKVQVGHIERFNPAYIAVKDKIDEPMFIELHRLGSFHPRNKDVPVVLDLLIHDIDIVLKIVKSPVKEIRASGVAVISDSPDITNARIEFENGCVANMTSSRISLKKMRRHRLFQQNAYVTIDFLEKKSDLVKLKELKEDPDDPFALVMDMGDGRPKKQIFFESPEIHENNALIEEFNSFYNSIITNRTPEVSIEDGCNALKLALEIMEQLNQNVVIQK